jgi:hypothetical protein
MIRVLLIVRLDTQGMEDEVAAEALGTVREFYLADGSTLPVAEVVLVELKDEEA